MAPPVRAQHSDHPRIGAVLRTVYELDDLSTARKSPGVTNRTPS